MNEETKKCPKCQEEVLKSAKKCKHCGSDLRNWFMRHKIISVFLILMFIGIISGGSSNTNNNSNTGNNVASQSQNQNNKPNTEPQTQPAANQTKEKSYQQVFAFSGNGAKKSEPFTITGDRFKVKYDCSGDFCQAFLKSTKNEYDVKIIMNSASAIKDETINYGAGEYYLESNCIGNYSMTVEDYK